MKKLLLIFLFSPAILTRLIFKRKSLLILVMVLFYHTGLINTFAQPSLQWYKVYGTTQYDESARAITVANNGYYFVLGVKNGPVAGSWVLKINENGDTIWTKSYGSLEIYAAASSGDGGCVFSGFGSRSFTIKIDSDGNVIWQKFYSTFGVRIYDLKKTLDGGYIACGFKASSPDGYILKINSFGDSLWQKVYVAGVSVGFRSIDIPLNGGYIIAGTITTTDSSEAQLLRLDDAGNEIWNKRYKVFNRNAGGLSINKTFKGYVLFGGTYDTTSPSDAKVYFLRIDTAGNVLFTKLFAYYKKDEVQFAKVVNSNKYIFTSFSYSFSLQDTSFSKVTIIDSMGNTINQRLFSSTNYVILYSILHLSNSDFILTGVIKNTNYEDILIIRTDSLLNAPPNGIIQTSSRIPETYYLYQNFPNPFNPTTTIRYDIPRDGMVSVKIYDILGREVYSINEFGATGHYEMKFDGSNYASGLYFYRLEAGSFVQTKKMMLVK